MDLKKAKDTVCRYQLSKLDLLVKRRQPRLVLRKVHRRNVPYHHHLHPHQCQVLLEFHRYPHKQQDDGSHEQDPLLDERKGLPIVDQSFNIDALEGEVDHQQDLAGRVYQLAVLEVDTVNLPFRDGLHQKVQRRPFVFFPAPPTQR